MDSARKIFLSPSSSNVVTAAVIAVVATFVGYSMWSNAKSMPRVVEKFGGVAKGSGQPDCLRTSAEAGQIVDFFAQRKNTTDEGEDDLRELTLILSKLSCLKKDLLSVSGIVEATRYQKYSTAHDLEPVAETTARCLAKTIPPRDLDLSFEKWAQRGKTLLDRLCTSYNATSAEHADLLKKFKVVVDDVTDIAKGACFVTVEKGDKSRSIPGYETPDLVDLGPYKGYY